MQCLYVCREAGDVGARRAKSPPDFLDVEKGIEAWNKQTIKGQSISKGFFGVYEIIEQKQVDLKYHSSKVEFIHSFFGRNVALKK